MTTEDAAAVRAVLDHAANGNHGQSEYRAIGRFLLDVFDDDPDDDLIRSSLDELKESVLLIRRFIEESSTKER